MLKKAAFALDQIRVQCSKCGAHNPDGFNRCGICGEDFVTPPRSARASNQQALAVQPQVDQPGMTATLASPPSVVYPDPDVVPEAQPPFASPSQPPASDYSAPSGYDNVSAGYPRLPASTFGPRYYDTPPSTKKWNWGAFLLTPIWSIANRVWIGLLAFVPTGFQAVTRPLGENSLVAALSGLLGLGSIALSVVLGLKGGEWAWKTGKFRTEEDFKQSQRKWAIAGFVVIGVIVLLVASVAALTIAGLRGPTQTFAPLTSDDGKVSLMASPGWQKQGPLNPQAALSVASNEAALIVIVEAKSALPNLSLHQYSGQVVEAAMRNLEGGKVRTGPTLGTVQAHAAIRYEFTGTANGLALTYLHTSFETALDFVQVVAWGTPDGFDNNYDLLVGITDSVTVR